MCWVAEKGTFVVLVAASSEDVQLKGRLCSVRRSLGWVCEPVKVYTIPKNVKKMCMQEKSEATN
jgi:hypothetical protein